MVSSLPPDCSIVVWQMDTNKASASSGLLLVLLLHSFCIVIQLPTIVASLPVGVGGAVCFPVLLATKVVAGVLWSSYLLIGWCALES